MMNAIPETRAQARRNQSVSEPFQVQMESITAAEGHSFRPH